MRVDLASLERLIYILLAKGVEMVLEYEFLWRDKLVKGYTYPIKRGDLDAALEKAGVTELDSVAYCCNPNNMNERGLFLSSSMLGEVMQGAGHPKCAPDITVHAVRVAMSQSIKEHIDKDDLLNSFALWLKKLEQADYARRMKNQFFHVYYSGEKLEVEHS